MSDEWRPGQGRPAGDYQPGADGRRRWPRPGTTRPPAEPVPDELPLCFAPVERPADAPTDEPPAFGTVRRGYDPGQVDAYVGALRERAAAADTERRRAEIAEDELREALTALKQARSDAERARTAPPEEPGAGFGERAERMLREAEQEAEQHREQAAEQAADVLARGRAEAESHRRETERALQERVTATENALAARESELAEREREIAERLGAAQADAAAITRDARADAESRAREVLEHATRDAAARRDGLEREITRLTDVRRTLRAELANLHRDLGRELADGPATPPGAAPGVRRAPEQRTDSGLDAARGARKVR